MTFYAPPELANLKQTKMPAIYEKTPVKVALPVADSCVLALYQADRAVKNMTGLSVNWEDLGAEPPNAVARKIATGILACIFMMELEPTLVTASSSSGVGICFKQGDVYADFECFNSGEVISSLIDSAGRTFSWEVGEQEGEIINTIKRIKQAIHA